LRPAVHRQPRPRRATRRGRRAHRAGSDQGLWRNDRGLHRLPAPRRRPRGVTARIRRESDMSTAYSATPSTASTASTGDHDSDRVVVITGAGGGVGAATVARFLSNGDTVIATDTSAESLTRLRTELDAGDRLVTLAGSITDESDMNALADAA